MLFINLKNLSANHRANDVIVSEDKDQILIAKFGYGPLDFGLSGEKVEIYIMTKNGRLNDESDWKLYATELTDSHGKIRYQLPQDKKLSLGMYQVKMVVKCDQSSVEFHMAVLPSNTEAVVFSIDGSFAANISFSGTDPKVRAGAVDVVRHWQDLGYLIIYITARPDIQHYKVTNWLAQHNFPLGLVYFSDGLSRDPIRQKTEILRNIILNNNIKIEAAYGSAKDIQMYSHVNIPFNKIFIIAKLKAKYANQAIVITNSFSILAIGLQVTYYIFSHFFI
jgi:phosphatidate phosphatase PAH1